jgi:hypothetical protein
MEKKNDRIYFEEEMVNIYKWFMNMEKELSGHEDNIKIITIFDK